MELRIKNLAIEYIKKNIGNYTDIRFDHNTGRITGILNLAHSKVARKRVFLAWENEILAVIK